MSAAQSLLGADRAVIGVLHGKDVWATASEFGERGVELLQLLLPAFKAGVHTQRRLAQHRAGLLRLLDTIDAGLHIFDERGKPLHQNAALGALLAAEPEPQRIRDQIPEIALAVSAILRRRAGASLEPPGPLCREVRTGTAIYQLRGTVLGQALLGPEVTIVVSIERITPEAISDATLMERYKLTPREVQVARRLGQGDPSAEIARSLGISRYTARHHAENVMRKLDVRSRAAVAARLMTA
ncbi:MAG: LuxR C-terminal-related transcriptional regulator [Gemmatimonadales bacterium]